MNEYLKEKWLRLRILKMSRMFEINYRILRNTAKLLGVKHAI